MTDQKTETLPEVRWVQRLQNYNKALNQLKKFIVQPQLNELELQGMIQCFEYTYELSWNTIKDFYESQGETNIQGSRDAIRLAFKRGLIVEGELWMEMIKSRSLTVHTYDEMLAAKIADLIKISYFPEFVKLAEQFLQHKLRLGKN